jgi:inosine triphosphate pyrophosphatase
LYNILAAYEDKSAKAVCTLAYIQSPHADPVLFTGECEGHIVAPESGQFGFGWDSIFVPKEYTQPFSQMDMAMKNVVSHRGRAVRQWADWLGQNQEVLIARQQAYKDASVRKFLGHQGLTFSLRPKDRVQ